MPYRSGAAHPETAPAGEAVRSISGEGAASGATADGGGGGAGGGPVETATEDGDAVACLSTDDDFVDGSRLIFRDLFFVQYSAEPGQCTCR